MHIRRVATSEELTACLAIRRAVFIDEQRVPEAEEIDGHDRECRHFLALPEKQSLLKVAMGTARLLFTDDGYAKAQRVAVVKAWRGKGVGAALMFALEGEAARAGFPVVVLAAQKKAIPFYERQGYVAYGDVFQDAGIEHRLMRKAVL